MSETDKSGSGGAGERKWDWSSPQIILAVIGIIVGLAGSVYGVALAAPFGQDLMCKTFNLSCQRTRFDEVQFSINAMDFGRWCEHWLAEMAQDPVPPPGYTGTEADCSGDYTLAEEPGYSGRIGVGRVEADGSREPVNFSGAVKRTRDVLLLGHLQMKHPLVLADTPFTLRAKCRRSDPATQQMAPVACKLSPPVFAADYPFDLSLYGAPDGEAAGAPEGVIAAMMIKDESDFIMRWRIDIDGQATADLTPGDYSVEIIIGAPGEPVEPEHVAAGFNVYPPQ